MLKKVLGELNWKKPEWLTHLISITKSNYQKNPKRNLIIVGITIFVCAVIIGLLVLHRPVKMPEAYAAVKAPEIIAINDLTADNANALSPIEVNFYQAANPQQVSTIATASVSPLNQIGHEVSHGVEIEPAIAGTWRWTSDSQLEFTPKQQWQAATKYTISISKNVITTNQRLKTPEISFTMPAFSTTIAKAAFNLNLKDPAKKNIVATLEFNYPVEHDTVIKHVQLTWPNGEAIPFQIQFDPFSRRAYLQSAQISVGKQTKFVALNVSKGIVTTQGQKETETSANTTIAIPSIYSYFKIEKISTAYVIDAGGNAKQVLNIGANIGTTAQTLRQHLQVYLLSKDDSKKIRDNDWVSKPQVVTEDMLQRAKVLSLNAVPTEFSYSPQQSYMIQAPKNRLLYINIQAGIEAEGGFLLQQPYRQLVETATPPQVINIVHKGSILSLTGQQKLQVVARGIPAVKITVYKILPKNLNQLLSQTYGTLENPKFLNPDDFNQDNISQRFSEIKEFPKGHLQIPNYFSVDVSNFQTLDDHLGLYLLTLQGYDPKTKEVLDTKVSRLIMLTNLGVIVKTNADNTQDVFVQSIATGNPIAAANVTLIGKNGVAIVQSTTDAQGHAHFFAFNNDANNEPLAYVVSTGDEESFIPFKRADRIINLSRFDIDGTYFDPQQKNQLDAYMFTDSGLYRPGTLVHVGMILKSINFASNPEQIAELNNLPLTFAISSPDGRVVNQQNINSNSSGLLLRDWQSPIDANSGNYVATLYLGNKIDDENIIGSVDFRVEAFTPATMKMKAEFNQQAQSGWVSSNNLQAVINMENLYGLPANHNKVTVEMNLVPESFYFANYPDYQFLDPSVEDKKNLQTITEKLTPSYTNATGDAKIPLDLLPYSKATYSLYIDVKGYQQDGSVAAETGASIMVSPLSYIVGYKTSAHLDFLQENSASKISFIALNSNAQPIALNDLTAELYVLQPISVLVEQADGTYAYQTKSKATLVKQIPYSIVDTGSDFELPSDKAGNFRLILVNAQKEKLSAVNYTVVGKTGYTIAQQANLALKLDKSVYLPGSEIQLALHTPYPGAGLITIEKDNVAAFKWFHSTGGDTSQTITIPADFHGTGYIEVNYARDLNAQEIFMNPFSYTVAPFSIDNTAQTISVNLQTPEVSLPGERLAINYSTDKPSKLIIFGVDKGVLAAADYESPNPLDYFFSKQALQVTTAQTLDLILPRFQENSLSTTGGDGGSLNKNIINPFQQNLRKPVMFWSKILDGSTQSKTLYYKVPDYFNGDLQIMAVAVNNTALGSAEKQSYIQAHFIMAPNVPSYVTPGDQFSAALVVTNNLKLADAKDPLTIQLEKTPNFSISSPEILTAIINPGQSQTFHFNLAASNQLGTSELKFIVSNGHKSSTLSQPITIQPATLYSVNLQNGFSKNSELILPADTNYYAAYRHLSISVGNQASIVIPGIVQKIKRAPFYNPKQFDISLLVKLNVTPRSSVDGEVLQQQLTRFYNALPNLQNSDGSFSGLNFLNQPIDNSLLIMNFLTIAKLQGYQIPMELFNLGLSYLQTYAYQNQIDNPLAQAKAILILTENEELTSNAIDHLQTYLKQTEPKTWQSNLATVYLAASYQLLQQQNYADNLVNGYISTQKNLNANVIQLLSQYFPAIAKKVITVETIQALIQKLNQGQTHIDVDIDRILALQDYAKFMPATNLANFEVAANVNNQWQILTTAPSIDQIAFPADAKQIRITATGNTGYFYQLLIAGFSNTFPTKAITNNLQVDADVQDVKDNSVNAVKLGDIVTVHLRIRSLIPDSSFSASIINLLPAGFQLISNSLNPSQYDQVNVRNDRLQFNMNVANTASEITYQLRAITPGKFVFPAVVANANQFGIDANSNSATKEMMVQ